MNQPKSISLLAGLFMITGIILSSCSTSEEVTPNNMNQQNGYDTGDAAPDFMLTALDGSQFKMSEQQDKVVVLFFFGNTCPSCRAVAPDIESKLKTAFASRQDYVIVGLDQWNGSAGLVNAFKDVTNVTFPLLLNAAAVGNSFKTTYDRLIVVDKKGIIAHRGSRAATNDINTVVATVNDLLGDM